LTVLDFLPATLPAVTTVAELARILDLHPATIRSWVRRGLFPKPFFLGTRDWRFRTDEVRQALQRMQEVANVR
jgi:excisionase family DNA binding protein